MKSRRRGIYRLNSTYSDLVSNKDEANSSLQSISIMLSRREQDVMPLSLAIARKSGLAQT